MDYLALRLHPEIIRLKELLSKGDSGHIYDVDLSYITPRGNGMQPHGRGIAIKAEVLRAISGYISSTCSYGFSGRWNPLSYITPRLMRWPDLSC